jgi:hypothetical protein
MRMLIILLFALLPGIAPSIAAAEASDARKALAAAKSLKCVFKTAIETNWEVDRYNTKQQKGFKFSIEGINTARGNAKAVSGQGASHLEMIALSNVRHFLGFTASGDLNVTSVHGQFSQKPGEFLASHSVHMASEPPRSFQHFGSCQAKAE